MKRRRNSKRIGRRPQAPARSSGRKRPAAASGVVRAKAVSARELEALRQQVRRRASGLRWNPDQEDVQRSVAQLVLTIVELLRRLMERQAIRRMDQQTLTRAEIDAVGTALMRLEETVREIGAKFGLTPEDLNLDLGPLGKLM